MPIWIWNEQKEYKEANVRNEKSTYKEPLRYSGKEQSVINIIFYPSQIFDQCHNFMDLYHPRHPRPNYMDPRTHAKILWTHATHAKIWPSSLTNPRTHVTHAF